VSAQDLLRMRKPTKGGKTVKFVEKSSIFEKEVVKTNYILLII
jgi:hypothetical protein